MIDNKKMSASLGNVIYPKDWLDVASPELLRMFYNKKVMKTRSFSWQDLPRMYDEFDKLARVYHGEEKIENKKELAHFKRLYDIAKLKTDKKPLLMSFANASTVAQVFTDEKDIIKAMEKTGHYVPEDQKFQIQETVPKDLDLTDKQKEALARVVSALKKESFNEDSLYNEFYNICKDMELPPKDLFQAGYKVLLNKERGPKLATLILAIGVDKVIKLFEKI
jgi:lysyl-tRNA synthetase class 1